MIDAAVPSKRTAGRDFAIGIALSIPVIGVRAWVFALYWSWFVVPVTGFRAVTVVEAVGLLGAVAFILPKPARTSDRPLWRDALDSLLYSALWFIAGCIVYWVIGLTL